MATERTPPHLRIARAEKAQKEWKMKAVKRREENQLLKQDLKYKNMKLENSKAQNRELKEQLSSANIKIAEQEKLIQQLKKKS
jgi:chromosome segregation ATPase